MPAIAGCLSHAALRLWLRPFAALLLALLVWPSSSGAVVNGNEEIVFQRWQDRPEVWAANGDGTAMRRVSSAGAFGDEPSLSPDGQLAVWTDRTSLWVSDITVGSTPHVVWTDTTANATLWRPHFSPDGKWIAFERNTPTTGSVDIWKVRTDGTGLLDLTPWKGNQRDVDFSPDGAKIAFSSYTNSRGGSLNKGGYAEIFKSNASDGSSATQLTTWGASHGGAYGPKFDPAGQRIAFYDNDNLALMNANGTNAAGLWVRPSIDKNPDWAPDGNSIIYSRQFQTSPESLYSLVSLDINNGYLETIVPGAPASGSPSVTIDAGAYRKGGPGVGPTDYEAAAFRPVLRFDQGEKWRPLSIDSFVGTAFPAFQNFVCAPGGSVCQQLTSLSTLYAFPDSQSFLRLGFVDTNGDATPQTDEYRSPNPACIQNGLLECDTGASGSIYYHVTPATTAGYHYIDYWVFYRYNDRVTDNHQSDWEGMVVAPSLSTPGTFDFAGFAQHAGDPKVYLRDNLECDAGGLGSCGTTGAGFGRRLWGYVAGGSHATYGDPCSGGCTESDSIVPETDHGGQRPWGRTYDAALGDSLIKLPAAAGWGATDARNWTDWPGQWDPPTDSRRIESPANQRRYKCPWIGNSSDSEPCLAKRALRKSAYGHDIPTACGNWFGGDVVAIACSPSRLRAALDAARLGRRGSVRILPRQRHARSASAPGIAQAVGRPLRVGQSLVISGRPPRDTLLVVRAANRAHLVTATFDGLRLRHRRGVVRVTSSRRGTPALRLVVAGKAPQRPAHTRIQLRRSR